MLNPYHRNVFDFAIATPADAVAGNPMSFINLPPGDSELALLQVQFDTDVNAADRTVEIHWNIGNGSQRLCSSVAIQTANSTAWYVAALSIGAYSAAGGSRIYMPLPPFCRSHPSTFYQLNAIGLQAGDRFTNLKLYWLRWIDGL